MEVMWSVDNLANYLHVSRKTIFNRIWRRVELPPFIYSLIEPALFSASLARTIYLQVVFLNAVKQAVFTLQG